MNGTCREKKNKARQSVHSKQENPSSCEGWRICLTSLMLIRQIWSLFKKAKILACSTRKTSVWINGWNWHSSVQREKAEKEVQIETKRRGMEELQQQKNRNSCGYITSSSVEEDVGNIPDRDVYVAEGGFLPVARIGILQRKSVVETPTLLLHNLLLHYIKQTCQIWRQHL